MEHRGGGTVAAKLMCPPMPENVVVPPVIPADSNDALERIVVDVLLKLGWNNTPSQRSVLATTVMFSPVVFFLIF